MNVCEKCGWKGGFHLCHGNLKPMVKVIPPPVAKPKKPTGPSRRGFNLNQHGPVYDYTKIAELHESGLLQTEIAMELGCSVQTVRAALREKYPEGYKVNKRTKTLYCEKGHNEWQEIPGRPGERRCVACRRIYDRNKYREKHGIPLDTPLLVGGERCPKNHEPNWLYDKRGTRQCRTCASERYYAKKKEKANGM